MIDGNDQLKKELLSGMFYAGEREVLNSLCFSCASQHVGRVMICFDVSGVNVIERKIKDGSRPSTLNVLTLIWRLR